MARKPKTKFTAPFWELPPDDYDHGPVDDLEYPEPHDVPPPPGGEYGPEVADAFMLISRDEQAKLLRSARIRELAGETPAAVKTWLIREALAPTVAQSI